METPLLQAGERLDALIPQNLEIIQSDLTFSFSVDAILLAHFAQVSSSRVKQVIDFCSGNGVIPLLLSAKTSDKTQIHGIEIQPQVADMAKRSMVHNDLADKITVHQMDLKAVRDAFKKDSVDVVTCNPPYFKTLPSSQKNPNRYLAIARHELTINLPIVAEKMSGLLKMNGKGYLVHRPERLPEIVQVLEKNRLMVKRIKFAYPKVNKPANIVLIEVIKDGKPGGLIVEPPLIVGDKDGNYTPEVEAMLNDN